MRANSKPSQPPAAPQSTSTAFQASPSWEPWMRCPSSMHAEYAATMLTSRNRAFVAGPSALSVKNPTSAKAAMLYALRNNTCQESAGGEVSSYTTSLIAMQNSAAATTTVAVLHQIAPEELA